jgi:hypothetical protein
LKHVFIPEFSRGKTEKTDEIGNRGAVWYKDRNPTEGIHPE